jgi:uncharacterized RDD family membrane protein YckC
MIQKPKRRERLLASFIDFIIFIPLTIICLGLSTLHIAIYLVILLILQVIYFWYYVYFQFKHGATLGKKKIGLKVYNINNTELTLMQCVKRYLNYYFFNILIAFILCFLIPSTPNEGFQYLSWQERMLFFYAYNRDYLTPLEYVGYIWTFVNLIFFLFDKQGRTRADYFAGTMVGKKVEDEIDTIGKEVE